MDSIRNSALKGLKWLEVYTKTDMVYLATGGFWLGIGQVVASGSAFLISVAFANLISPEIFGKYKYILSIYSLLTITTLAGMDSAIAQAIARENEEVLIPGVKEKIKWGVIGSVLSIILGIYYLYSDDKTLAYSFILISPFIPLLESTDMYNSFLWGKKLFGKQVFYNVIKKIFSLVIIILTLKYSKSVLMIVLAYFISNTLPNIYFLLKVKSKYIKRSVVDAITIDYGKSLSLVGIVRLVSSEIDKILIFHYLGAIDLAIYSIAISPLDQIKGLLKNVNNLAMPKFANRDINSIIKSLNNKIFVFSITTISITVLYILLLPKLFDLVFPKYHNSIIYSQILSISLIGGVLISFFYTILESQKAKREIYIYNLTENFLNIIILFIFIYYFGIWGAITARIISRFIFTIFGYVLVTRMQQLSR